MFVDNEIFAIKSPERLEVSVATTCIPLLSESEKTSIVIYEKDKLKAFNVLTIGSNHITKDISKVLNLPKQTSINETFYLLLI